MSKSLKHSCKLGPKPIKVAVIHWLQIFHLCEKFIFLHTKLFHKKKIIVVLDKYMLWFYFILGFIFISHCFKLTQALPYPTTRKIKFKSRIKLNHNIYDREFHCGVIVESAKKRRSS